MPELTTMPLFLCDVMLARFCRYLRAAGFDAALADGAAADREVVRQAVAEGRWLLTLDRGIAAHKAGRGRVVLLVHGSLDEQARALAHYFALNWTARAFTRCLIDNARLLPASPQERARAPADVGGEGAALLACPVCDRVYWPGSHYRRMSARLRRWQAEFGAGAE